MPGTASAMCVRACPMVTFPTRIAFAAHLPPWRRTASADRSVPSLPVCSAWRTLATHVRRRRRKPCAASWVRRSERCGATGSHRNPRWVEDLYRGLKRCCVGRNDARDIVALLWNCGQRAQGFAHRVKAAERISTVRFTTCTCRPVCSPAGVKYDMPAAALHCEIVGGQEWL